MSSGSSLVENGVSLSHEAGKALNNILTSAAKASSMVRVFPKSPELSFIPATARGYAFSSSCRPLSSCSTVRRMPSRMSSGSNPVTTIGTPYRCASGGYSAVPITLQT